MGRREGNKLPVGLTEGAVVGAWLRLGCMLGKTVGAKETVGSLLGIYDGLLLGVPVGTKEG